MKKGNLIDNWSIEVTTGFESSDFLNQIPVEIRFEVKQKKKQIKSSSKTEN